MALDGLRTLSWVPGRRRYRSKSVIVSIQLMITNYNIIMTLYVSAVSELNWKISCYNIIVLGKHPWAIIESLITHYLPSGVSFYSEKGSCSYKLTPWNVLATCWWVLIIWDLGNEHLPGTLWYLMWTEMVAIATTLFMAKNDNGGMYSGSWLHNAIRVTWTLSPLVLTHS